MDIGVTSEPYSRRVMLAAGLTDCPTSGQEKAEQENLSRRYRRSGENMELPTAQLPLEPEPSEKEVLEAERAAGIPQLLTDGGELRCSRCSGKRITCQADTKEYFCALCGRLEFQGFFDEGPMAAYYPSTSGYEWMR